MGLPAALEGLAERLPMPISLEVDELELPPSLRASIYFFCCEALTNTVKHADASTAGTAASHRERFRGRIHATEGDKGNVHRLTLG